MHLSPSHIDTLFGPGETGSASERALLSNRRFIHEDALLRRDDGGRGGRRFVSAWETWSILKDDLPALQSLAEHGQVRWSKISAGAVLEQQRSALGLSVEWSAKKVGLQPERVASIERVANPPLRDRERIAIALGLDERQIMRSESCGDAALAYRLKTLRHDATARLSPAAILCLSEAAWVTQVQARLALWMGVYPDRLTIEPDGFYGDSTTAPWEAGFRLAAKTRARLGLSPDEPVISVRTLIEDTLGLPVLQARLPERIAGATITNNRDRAVVVNTQGANENVWVRRATLAHELAHLMWDSDEQLQHLLVDSYDTIETGHTSGVDRVEQRANAFAIEFLAPQAAVRELVAGVSDPAKAVRLVMEHFGISLTAAKSHLENTLNRTLGWLQIDANPTDEWRGRESLTLDWFPHPDTPTIRRGTFSALVAAATSEGLISGHTAALYLNLSRPPARFAPVLQTIEQCFPEISERAHTWLKQARATVKQAKRRNDVWANHVWLQKEASAYAGRWVAIRDGALVVHEADLKALIAALKSKGRTLAEVSIAELGRNAAV